MYERASCKFEMSPTTGTIFEYRKVPLTKWFAAIYLMNAEKRSISAQRLLKMIDVQSLTANRILRKLRQAMEYRVMHEAKLI